MAESDQAVALYLSIYSTAVMFFFCTKLNCACGHVCFCYFALVRFKLITGFHLYK